MLCTIEANLGGLSASLLVLWWYTKRRHKKRCKMKIMQVF